MLLEGISQEVPWTSQDFPLPGTTGVYIAMLLEGMSYEVPGTSRDFHDLGLQECSYVTRRDIPGLP